MSISHHNMRIQPMVKGSLCCEIENSITGVNKNHEKMWLEPPTDHSKCTHLRGSS